MRPVLLATCVLALSACTTVSFQQLRAEDLAAKPRSPNGAVYYLPKPYLVVAQLPAPAANRDVSEGHVATPPPPAPSRASTRRQTGRRGGRARSFPPDFPSRTAGGAAPADKKGDDQKSDDNAPAQPAVAGSSDQSFGGLSGGYMIKIVYLPDLSRPMAMSVRAGLGTASLKPTLQNGWMLTGFEANADSKTSEILSSVASVITAFKTPGKSAGGGDAKTSGGGAESQILRPGLYDFRYNDSGALVALCPLTYFDSTGTKAPTLEGLCIPTQPAAAPGTGGK